eukprot:scaffold60268_cov27-Tisochrysis_lutea.AAC.17
MAFNDAHASERDTGPGDRGTNKQLLRRAIWSGQTGALAILPYCHAEKVTKNRAAGGLLRVGARCS